MEVVPVRVQKTDTDVGNIQPSGSDIKVLVSYMQYENIHFNTPYYLFVKI
jgi:hypothetical protein